MNRENHSLEIALENSGFGGSTFRTHSLNHQLLGKVNLPLLHLGFQNILNVLKAACNYHPSLQVEGPSPLLTLLSLSHTKTTGHADSFQRTHKGLF